MTIEILTLKQDVAFLEENISNSKNYIEYLKQRYTNPWRTIRKYHEKIEKWTKEKYEIQKEIVVLEQKELRS